MLKVSFNGVVGGCDRATSRGDPMPPMRVSPNAASPSVRVVPVLVPSPDNSGASSVPGSLLPDLEAAARVPLGRACPMLALEAVTFEMACLLQRRPSTDRLGGTEAPITSTSDSPPMDESDDTSRSAASGSFRSAEAAAFFPTSPSGRGAGD